VRQKLHPPPNIRSDSFQPAQALGEDRCVVGPLETRFAQPVAERFQTAVASVALLIGKIVRQNAA
jgi:hypothetical protein